jgi:hypothetical protein
MAWMAGSEPGHDKTVFAKEIARTFAPLTFVFNYRSVESRKC